VYLSIMPLIATTLTTTSTSTHLATIPRLVLAIPIDNTPQDLHLLSPSPKESPQQKNNGQHGTINKNFERKM
jgi:hypothetical protein